MTKIITDMKAKSISVNPITGQYTLTVAQPNPFSATDVTVDIMLWSRNNGVADDQTIERTQAALRENLQDETIIFSDPSADGTTLQNPSHIVNWLAAHPMTPIKAVNQNDKGYYNIGEGFSGESSNGGSKYRNMWDGTGVFNPETERVSVFDALTSDKQNDILNGSGPSLNVSKTGNVAMNFSGQIVDVVLTSANKWQTTPMDTTRATLKTQVLQLLANPVLAGIKTAVEGLPEDYALADLVTIIGGTDGANLDVDPVAKSAIPGLIDNANRMTLRFYVKLPETGKVIQTSAANLARGSRSFGLHFEYVVNDLSKQDFNKFIPTVSGLDLQEAADELRAKGLFDAYDNPTTLLETLRTVFVGREVQLNAYLGRQGKLSKDTSKLGARAISVGIKQEIVNTPVVESVEPVAPFAKDEEDAPSFPPSAEEIAQLQAKQVAAQAVVNEPVAPVTPVTPVQETVQPTPAPTQPAAPTEPTNPFGQGVSEQPSDIQNPFAPMN